MRNTAKYLLAGIFTLMLGAGAVVTSRVLYAQGRPAPPKPVSDVVPTTQTPTFRLKTDLVSLDVIVRDSKGQFVADLKPQDFEILEDGVKQEIISFVLSHGGRTYNQKAPPQMAIQEGVYVPAS